MYKDMVMKTFDRMAHDNNMESDQDLYRCIEAGRGYTGRDVNAIFDEWYVDKLKKSGLEKLKSKKKKVLLLGHSYNLLDSLIGGSVTKYLKENDIEIIYSHEIDRNIIEDECKRISKTVHWTMNKELLGAFSYYKDKVDGIILITAFPCGPDSLTNEMIIRKKGNSKVLLLTFEEINSDIAIITRLESFIDMLKGGIHL